MKVCVLLVGLCLMSAYVTMVEVPGAGELPDNLELISIASGDWWGKHVDDLIAACGDPTRTIGLVNGGRKLIYRVPLYQGWSLTGENPTLEDLHHEIDSIREADPPADAGTADPDSADAAPPVVIGKLSLVFETSENDRVVGVAVEQKLKKRYRDGPAD